jgi:hypothetical protein
LATSTKKNDITEETLATFVDHVNGDATAQRAIVNQFTAYIWSDTQMMAPHVKDGIDKNTLKHQLGVQL